MNTKIAMMALALPFAVAVPAQAAISSTPVLSAPATALIAAAVAPERASGVQVAHLRFRKHRHQRSRRSGRRNRNGIPASVGFGRRDVSRFRGERFTGQNLTQSDFLVGNRVRRFDTRR